LGVFIEDKPGVEHPEFAKLMDPLKKASKKGQRVAIDATVNPAAFLPEDKTFFTYEGSLTTPPLLESVIWTVFKEHVYFSEDQVKMMRCLKIKCEDADSSDEEGSEMVDNYRPPCPLGGRKVKVSA